MLNDADVPDRRPAAIAGGLILLAIGLSMLLDHTLIRRLGDFSAPLVLILLGASTIVAGDAMACGHRVRHPDGTLYRGRRARRRSAGGVWLIGIGAWMLVSQTRMFGLSFDTSWPLLVILGGLLIMVRGLA